MKKSYSIIILVLIVILGTGLGIFIYKKTGLKDYVEQKKNERLENDIVATVADRTITETEAQIYLAAMKSQIESIYGEEVWSYKIDDEGTQYSEIMKQSVLDKMIYIKLVCANAEGYGVKLTADDRLDVDKYVTDFFGGISEETATKYDLTEEMVTKIYEENVLAAKVYDKITLNYNVDANSDNCRQGRFIVMKLNKYEMVDGEKKYFSDEELLQISTRAEGICSAMKNGNAYQVAVSNGTLEEPRITCGQDYFSEEIREEVFALSEGELSPVLQDQDSFYVVYCEQDYDEKATEAAIQSKITEERNAYFTTLYTTWKDSANIKVDEEKWGKIN
ncbi:MAG: SurA N-terminal domain-containing protein [Lachnospiraceae bacterium]